MLLLGGLLVLRVPFSFAVTLWQESGQPAGWARAVFILGTYVLTAAFIWWERERLRDFHIDVVAGVVFMLQTFCFPIGIGLFALMRRRGARWPAPPRGIARWMLLGLCAGLAMQIAIQWLGLNPAVPRTAEAATLSSLLFRIPLQMTNAAVFEEPLFRGFLWGYLRKAGLRDVWIWLVQAGLFVAGHIYYLNTEPFGPWLIRMLIPSLLFGLIAWQARSIAASMAAHGATNAAGDMIMHSPSAAEALSVSAAALGLFGLALGAVVAWELWQRRGLGRAGAA
jgi:hypothetical protein